MRGVSLLPLAALALFSDVVEGKAQAVNIGGAVARIPGGGRSFANSVPAGVQRQSPGNSIVTDGQTATNVQVRGRTTTITTDTMSGGNAYNSFKTFSEAQGNTVNLIVPNSAGKLVNIVREGSVNIQGTLNAYKNGKIGGNVVFADSYGLVVGASGSINVGGLTVVTPNKATIDGMIVGGRVNDGLVARVVTGDVPLSADGSVVINGRVNATHFIKITATDVKIAGSLQAAQKVAEQKAQFAATVNTRGWQGSGQLVARNGSISISGANSVQVAGTIRAGTGRNPGAITVASGKSVHITGTLKAEGAAGRDGGKIKVTSGGDIAIGKTATISVAGVGKNSSAGAITVKAGSNLAVDDGARFVAHGGESGDGGFVELSAAKVETLGNITVDLGAAAGRAGSLLLDPADLVIGAVNHSYSSFTPNISTNGGNVNLVADNSIILAADGVIDTRSSNGAAGSVTLTAPQIALLGGSHILAGATGAGAAGIVTLTAVAVSGGNAGVAIGDVSGARAVIAGQDLIIRATANAGGSTAHATVSMTNADVTLAGKLDVAALAGVTQMVNSVGAVATTDVLAAVDVLGSTKLVVSGLAVLQATASNIVSATAAPNALSSLVADASAAVVTAGSVARVHIGDTADVNVTGSLTLSAGNTVSSTSRSDASGSSAAGASVAVNILTVQTTALVDGAARITSGPLTLSATSSVSAVTFAKAASQGAGEAGNGSTANKYMTDAKYAPQESTSDGGVKAAGALAIADLTLTTLAQMKSTVKAVVSGATTLNTLTGNSSSVTADGSSATGSTGVGVAVAVALSRVSNKSLLEQQLDTAALTLSATMAGTAADNSFAVSATSGAAATNVGVAGALASNFLDSESLARIGGSVAILPRSSVSLTAADLTTATAVAAPSGSGMPGAKVGVGASVVLNFVATRSTAELADGASLTGAGDVTLQATGVHNVSTRAEQGSAGGIAVTPVIALTMASDRTRASVGALTGGLDASGNVTVSASQLSSALTQASGAATGGKAAVGAALAVAILDEQTIATTSSSIRTAGSVSFSAQGAAFAATAAVASASGGNGTDSSGASSEPDSSVDAKVAKETQGASAKGASAGVGDADQQSTTKTAAASENGQGKTSDGSVAVAAAIGATVLQSKVQAYVPASVGISSGALSVTSVANVDAKTSADGSAVGTDAAAAKVGVGVGLSLNLVRSVNNALLGGGTAFSTVTPGAIAGVTADQYRASSVTLKATQDELGVVAPVVTAVSPAAVDAARLAQASIVAGNGQHLDIFASNASAGAGGSSVGVAGAVAVNLIDTASLAQVTTGQVILTGNGAVTLASDNESSTIARAMPASTGASGGKVGVGASVALNLLATRSTAELADGITLSGAGDVNLNAVGVHGIVTQAEQGSAGGIAVTPVIALTMASDRTRASVGAITGGLDATGDVSVSASQLSSALTQASGAATGGKAAVGAALAVAVLDEQTIATTSSSIRTAGSVSFSAQGAALAATAAVASASGGNGTDSSGASTDADGSVDAKVQKQSTGSSQRMSAANVGDSSQQSTVAAGGASANGKASTSEGGVAVAAAIAVDVSIIKVNALVPSSVGIQAGKALSVTSVANVDAKTSADGSTSAASGSGSTPSKAGVGAAVAVNVIVVENRAELGSSGGSVGVGQITGVTPDTYAGSALTVSALKTDLGTASPVAVGVTGLPQAPSATTALGRVDQFVAYAKSGASGANISVAGSLAVNVITSKSIADVDSGAVVTIVPTGAGGGDGAVTLAADNETYVAASALPVADGASGQKLGVGASVALNTILSTSEAMLAQNAALTGATALTVKADSRLDSDAMAQAGAKGGTALDAVVAFTILSQNTTASIESGGLISVGGDVAVRATSVGAHSAISDGSATSSGSGGTAIGGSVALITGTGLFDIISGQAGPITSNTVAKIARSVSSTRDLTVSASGTHTYVASATATAGGGSTADKGAAGGSSSTSSKTLGSAPASGSMQQEQDGLSSNGGGSSGGKLSVAAALGAAIVGDGVKASIGDALTLGATRNVLISATSTDQVQTMGSAAAVSPNQDNGIGIGAALSVIGNTTAANVGNAVHIVSGGSVTVAATSSVNNGLGGFTAEAMSGASGKKLAVAGALAIGVSTSSTSATVGDSFKLDIAGDAITRAGAVAVTALNTSSLAAKAWSGSYSAEGNGVGASIATAISNDSYTASIGNSAVINAASVNVFATNARVDDIFSSIRTLAQPVAATLSDINADLTTQASNAASLASHVTSAAGASDAVSSFKSGFADQITSDKKKILDTLKSTAMLARDLPILGSNNFYTEVVAGSASGEKLAISGGLALQIMLESTTATIGSGASINATGAVSVAAQDNAVSRTLVGALAASGGSSAAGISLGIIINKGSVNASIGNSGTISQSGSIGITAVASHGIDLFEISAGAADANGIAGILGVVYSQADVSAQTGAGSSLTSAGALNVAASNTVNTLNLAGGIAIGGNNGIGGVLINTTVKNTAVATIDSNSTAATNVNAGSVSVSAQTSERMIDVAVAGAGAGSNAIAGVATPLIQILTAQASIGNNARVMANSGDVSVTAADTTLLINIGGVIAIGGSNGVGGAAAVGVLTDTIKAFIGDDATVDSAGSVIVTAKARETISDAVVSGSGGGNIGVAVALASSVVVDNVSATIGKRDRIGTIIRPSGVLVSADDTTLVVDIAGTISVGGSAGIGAGVDANVLTKNTTATVDNSATIRTRGDVVVQATSAETVFSLVAGFAAGGDAGVAGSVGAFVLAGNTLAAINSGADVRADGNIGVIAKDANELNRLVGSGAVGGTAGVGGAIGVSVVVQTTKATISDDTYVEAFGLTQPTLGVVTGIGGSFRLYGADALSVIPGLSSLSGTVGNDVNAVTVADGLVAGGSLLVLQRTTTPVIQQVHGVAVSASATSLLRSLVVSGSVGGTAGVSISGDVPVVVSDTEATIGARARINTSGISGAGQSVVVAASSDLYHLGIAGSVAVGGTAGVGAGAETAVFKNTTIASVGPGSDVRAASDVAVTAKASENFAGSAVSAGIGGTAGVAGGLTGFAVVDVTKATIYSSAGSATSVTAGGNVVVDAEDQARAVVTGGTIAIGASAAGVGIGVGLAVVVKDTEATIGDYANVTALGNGTGSDLTSYTGTDFTSTRSSRGILVQANSGESVTGIVVAGAGGLYAGVAGAIAAEVFVNQTRAAIGQNVTINGNNGGANANQDVTVTARDSIVVSIVEGTVAVGIAGVGGAVDVAVITAATSAYVGDNTSINAARFVTIDALTNRQTASTVASVAGGIAGVGAAISVLAVANGPNADQTSKTDSNGSFNDSANSKLQDDTVDSKFLSSSTNSNVRDASTKTQGYKNALNLQPTLPTGIAPGNSATIGSATINAGGSVNVRARDVVNAVIADGAVAAGAGGGAGIGVAVISVNNTAIITNGARVTAGALDVSAVSARTLNGYGVAATAVGVAAALISLTDSTTTTATINSSTVNTGASAFVHASNNDQITIATATLASGAAGGLSLVVVNPDTEARIDGASVINAALSNNGSVEVSSSNVMNINSGAAGVAVGGGGGVGLTVVVETPKTLAFVDNGSTISSGLLNTTAGDVLVNATTQISMISVGAGVSLGDGVGGALTIVTRSETTNAEIAAATVTATGNVGVVANSTSDDDLLIGGAAVAGGAGVGGSLGVTVLSSSVTASIDANADVTALGRGSDFTYIQAYETSFSGYGSSDKIKTANLEGVSGGSNVLLPVTTGDVKNIGSSLLLQKGTIVANTAAARGVVVNAAKGESIRSIVVSGALGGLVGVGLSGNVPVIGNTTSATIGAGALINQRMQGSAGAAQSAVVAATSDIYSLNIVGALGGGGAVGIGASISPVILSNATYATIGHDAQVFANNNVIVQALAGEDIAMVAAAGAAGGFVSIAGGLSLISVDDTTKALIDKSAIVLANNNVIVSANDITREATFAGSIVLSGGGAIGAAVAVGLITKHTDAIIDANARVSGLAQGSDRFTELTGPGLTASRLAQGVLVNAQSAESAYIFALGAGGGVYVAAAGAISVNVFNTSTFATINSGAVINGAAGGTALQDVAVTARDLTGIVSMSHGIALSGIASLAGAVDVGVLNSNVGASIGDATVSAGRDVIVNAQASKAIDSTAYSAAASAIALSAGVSVYAIGNGVDPNGKASSELTTSDSSGSATNFAGNSLSVGGSLGTTATGTTSASNGKSSGSSVATSSASSASASLNAKLGSINVSGKMTAQNAAVAGTSATLGNAQITAGGKVSLNGNDQVTYTAKTGAISAGIVGVGAGIGIFSDNATTTATGTGTGSGTINAGSVSVLANTGRSANLTSLAGSFALSGALEADVALVTDNSVTRAGLTGYMINESNGLTVAATTNRQLTASAAGAAVAIGAGVGVSVAQAIIGGSVTTTLQDLTIGSQGTPSGFVTTTATSTDTAQATAKSTAGGVGGAGSGAESTATVNPQVAVSLTNDTIYSNGAVTLQSLDSDSANARSEGVAIAGGLSVGASIANASLSPQALITITGGHIEADSLQSDAKSVSRGAIAYASGASGAFIGINATQASASDSSQVIAAGTGGFIQTTNALNFNALTNESNTANATGLAVGIVAIGANVATASSNSQTKAVFNNMTQLTGGSITLDAESTDNNVATSVSGSGGVISGASSKAETNSTNVTVAQIAGTLGGTQTNVNVTGGTLALIAHHADVFSGSVDSTQAAVVGASGARLVHNVNSMVLAGLGDNVSANAANLTIDAANSVKRLFICETCVGVTSVDQMGWDVQSGSGGFVDAPAATGNTTVLATTFATLGQNTRVHLLAPAAGTGLASISAFNDITVHQKTKVDSGGAVSVASGEANVTVTSNATVSFGQSSSLIVDVGDVKAAAWSNVNVDARTAVTTNGLAGAPTGSAKANVTVNSLLSTAKNVRIEASHGVFPVDGSLPTNGTVTLLAGRSLSNAPGSLTLNTVVDLYNNTAIPIPTKPDAQSNLTSNAIVSIAQSDTPPSSTPDVHYGVRAAGDIKVFADQGTMTTNADGTGTNIYLKALSKVASAISEFFGGGEVSFDIKGGSTQQNGTSTLLIDGTVETGIARVKSLTITYDSSVAGGCDPSGASCLIRAGAIGSTVGTYQAGGAILDRLGQITALLVQYEQDVIAKAAYLSEQTFLQAKLVALGLATGIGSSFQLVSGVTLGTPAAGASQNLASLNQSLTNFSSQVATSIGSDLTASLTNIASAWNGTDAGGFAVTGADTFSIVTNGYATLAKYQQLSGYSAKSAALNPTVGDVTTQVNNGNNALGSARSDLQQVTNNVNSITTNVNTIVSNATQISQGLVTATSVSYALSSAFTSIGYAQSNITSSAGNVLNDVRSLQTAANKLKTDLDYIKAQSTPSTQTTNDANILNAVNASSTTAASNGVNTRISNSISFINTQIDGGTIAISGQSNSTTTVRGVAGLVSDYNTSVQSPAKSIADWQTEITNKAQISSAGSAGSVGATSLYLQLDNTAVQLGNVYLGGKTVSTSGSGKIYAPGDARIDITNETAATLKIQNLTIPLNDAGHITVNGAAVYVAADIAKATNTSSSGFSDANVITAASSGQPQINITSNYNPESSTYYNTAANQPLYIRKLQIAPDIILLSGSAINNLNGSVNITSQAGNIYIQGAINAGSVSIVARNGDLVTSYVNGFNHVGGDPASAVQVPGSAVTPSDPVVTGLGIIANGQVFLAARYLNINSTVQSGIANWNLTLDQTMSLVTTDATRISGLVSSDVAQKVSAYQLLADKTNVATTYVYHLGAGGNSVTLDLTTGNLLFSMDTANSLGLSGAYKFLDTGSGKANGIYSGQAGASYDASARQVVIDGTSVHGGYIKIFGQIINTSATANVGNLNVLDGFGTINITNNTPYAVVLSTLNTGADPTGTGRGTAGVIDITDVHIDALDANVVDATHTIFTRDLDPLTGTRKVMVNSLQGILDPTTGAFIANGATVTSGAVSTGDRTGVYTPLLNQRYVWTTATDYTVTNTFDIKSFNVFHDPSLAVAKYTEWLDVTTARSPSIRLLDGTYVSTKTTDTTSQTIDGRSQLVVATSPSSVANSAISSSVLQQNTVKYLTNSSLKVTGKTDDCVWWTLCIADKVTTYYTATSTYREITTNSMKADNPINVNFIGADVGTINVTSGTNIILKGNLTNVAGLTTITAQNNASIIQSSSNPTITAKSVNLTAGGSIGGVVADSFVALPLSVALTTINGKRGQLDANAGTGNVAITSPADLIIGQVTSNGSAALGMGSVTLSAATNILAASTSSLVQGDRVSLTALTGALGSVANGVQLNVNTGFTTDQSLRPYGDLSSTPFNFGLSASAAGDINIRANSWSHNPGATILANSIVSLGGDIKLTTVGQVLDGNPVQQIDQKAYQQLVDYWNTLGLTAGANNDARQAAMIKAFEQSQTQSYKQYWQIRDSQTDRGAAFDPTFQVVYVRGTAQYQNLDSYYRNLETAKNNGAVPANIETLVANDIATQATADTARYRALNTQVGALTTSFDAGYAYTASVAEKANLTQGSVWTQKALGFPLSAGALKTITNTNAVIKAPNVSGRNVTILADSGLGESVIVAGQTTPGITINPTNDPVRVLTDTQKIALATAERTDLLLTIGGVRLPTNATAAQIDAYNAAVAAGLTSGPTQIPLGTEESKMTLRQQAALNAAAAGIASDTGTYLTVLSKRPLNVAETQTFNATVTTPVVAGNPNTSDIGKAFVASRGNLELGTVSVTGETRIKAIGSLINAANSTIKTGNIVLESATGAIGSVTPLVLNLRSDATITARALNFVNLSSVAGSVNGSNDAFIDTVYSPNQVTIRAARSILNSNTDQLVNVLGGNVVLTADTGSIGTIANSLNVGTSVGGNITATARGGQVNLYGVAGLDFTIASDIAGTSTKLVAAGDGTIDGPVRAGTDISISTGGRLVLTANADVLSGAGQILISADTVKMLRGALITTTVGAIQVNTINDALVSNIVSGSSDLSAIFINAGGHIIAGADPARAFDLSAVTPGAGIKLVAGLGIGDETQADLYAVDQRGSAVGSANLITAVANPLIIRTGAINATATRGDVDLVAATSILSGSVVSGGGSVNVVANQNFNVATLSALAGEVVVTAVGSLSAANVTTTNDALGGHGRVALTANDVTFGTIAAGGPTDLVSTTFINGSSLTAGGQVTQKAGTNINITTTRAAGLHGQAAGNISCGSVTTTSGDAVVNAGRSLNIGNMLATSATGGGNIALTANDITFGTINASGAGSLTSANFITGYSLVTGGPLSLDAGGDITIAFTRAKSLKVETAGTLTFGDLTIDNPLAISAQNTNIGVLHASPNTVGPLVFTLTGYHGGIGQSANIYIDAPLGVVMPQLRETRVDLRTNALNVSLLDATIVEWLKLTTPNAIVWDDNRSPRPVLGYDVQLFQPSKQFALDQNGYRSDTNAVVMQYSERAEVIERRNGERLLLGGSFVRDIDRAYSFGSFGSVLIKGDSANDTGPFFHGDAFDRFMESLRDRSARRPLNQRPINLKGIDLNGFISEGYRITLRGGR